MPDLESLCAAMPEPSPGQAAAAILVIAVAILCWGAYIDLWSKR